MASMAWRKSSGMGSAAVMRWSPGIRARHLRRPLQPDGAGGVQGRVTDGSSGGRQSQNRSVVQGGSQPLSKMPGLSVYVAVSVTV